MLTPVHKPITFHPKLVRLLHLSLYTRRPRRLELKLLSIPWILSLLQMSNYPLEYSVQHVAQGHTGDAGAFRDSLKPGRRDERDSQTPSDDGSGYLHYSKNENDLEGAYLYLPFVTYRLMRLAEDPNTSLIAQTLNTDGTPKRPMNAFMIFARRRRPQVSAENQTMRTGEISKILSKEWNAMELVNNVIPVSTNSTD